MALSPIVDSLTFGSDDSEKAHQLVSTNSDVIPHGGLGDSARRLLPNTPNDWQGGTMSFVMKVDPAEQTYFTIRLWGSDVSIDRLVLFCEGKQVGYLHLGDVDLLDSPNGSPAYNERFFYNTSPLPLAMTKDKTELHFEIRSQGRIWGYGTTWEQYQKDMTDPTRGIYRVYTHTDGCFVPPADDKQGAGPNGSPIRLMPGPEVLDQLKDRVNGQINKSLKAGRPLDQLQMLLLARAYRVDWTPAFQNNAIVPLVIAGVDDYYRRFHANPDLAHSDKSVFNSDWVGFGPMGDTIRLLAAPLKPSLDDKIDDGTGQMVVRRDAWSDMLQASRDWHLRHRRQYSNQSMITDLYMYLANRGIEVIDPKRAMPEKDVRQYLYQSVACQPWLGNLTDSGPAQPLGSDYMELTSKGLTKELGFVGYYGEVLDWATSIFIATADPDKPGLGDEKIKAQIVKMEQARSYFRYPSLDDDGNRAMRSENVIGWRDMDHYPGDVTYSERPTWDASSLYCAASTRDPVPLGHVQQMMEDNQFFASVAHQMVPVTGLNGMRVTLGLLRVPDQYDLIKAQDASPHPLPMTLSEPDFVFTDEEDGVLAIKHGNEMLYASLYWRARAAINFLARVHYIVPQFDRIAVVHEDTEFEPSGQTYTRPDWTNMGFANGGLKYPDDRHSAFAGEVLPIAKYPDGVELKPGVESPYAGRGSFYRLLYGNYLIGMNTTKDKTYVLKVPAGHTEAPELVSGRTIPLDAPVNVGPSSTIVLFLGPAQP